jgi:hypothetical protein
MGAADTSLAAIIGRIFLGQPLLRLSETAFSPPFHVPSREIHVKRRASGALIPCMGANISRNGEKKASPKPRLRV